MTAPDGGHRRAWSEDVTALISTHGQETAANLAASLDSMRRQTLPPGRIVLVVDGPVDGEQEEVIAVFRADDPPGLDVVRLERNVGLADAMNAGLDRCTTPWVMRMDSDDLCTPDRLEIQSAYLEAHPGSTSYPPGARSSTRTDPRPR